MNKDYRNMNIVIIKYILIDSIKIYLDYINRIEKNILYKIEHNIINSNKHVYSQNTTILSNRPHSAFFFRQISNKIWVT